jgi:hypothetical protein
MVSGLSQSGQRVALGGLLRSCEGLPVRAIIWREVIRGAERIGVIKSRLRQPTRLARFARVAAFVGGIAPYDLIESVHCGYFAPLRSLLQGDRGLGEGGIADAIDRGAVLVNLKAHLILLLILFLKHVSYLWWNSARKPLAASACRKWNAAELELSGRGALAAATARSACVLIDGWPVVSVHCSLGLALQTGQRTDNMRFNES